MRQLAVVDAKREAAKARIALSGPPGAGKTWTALRIARVLAPEGTVLFLDTEHESAKLYAPPFEFKHAAWTPPYDAKELTQAIYHYAAHVDVMIIDSLSHFWQGEGGVLDVASGKFTGWKEARPIQRAMVEAIVRAPCHFIGCMRSKIEYAQTAGKDGKQKVERLGQADIQSDEMPYEFTIAAELDLQHRLTITKTRCADLDGRVYQPHQETDMAETLLSWLNIGEQPNGPVDREIEQALAADTMPKPPTKTPEGGDGSDMGSPAPAAHATDEQDSSGHTPSGNIVTDWLFDKGIRPANAAAFLRKHDSNKYGRFTDKNLAALVPKEQEDILELLIGEFDKQEVASE